MDAYCTAIKLPHTYMLLGMGYNKISFTIIMRAVITIVDIITISLNSIKGIKTVHMIKVFY